MGVLELGNGIYVSISMNGSDTPVTRPETDNTGLSSRDRCWESCPGAFLYRTKFSNNEGNDNFLKEKTFQQLRYPANTSVVIDGLRANCRYCISHQAVYETGTSDFGQKHYITTSLRVNRKIYLLHNIRLWEWNKAIQ